jgi:hypothetical protein
MMFGLMGSGERIPEMEIYVGDERIDKFNKRQK